MIGHPNVLAWIRGEVNNLDSSIEANTVTPVNAPTIVPVQFGRGIRLNGSNQYITIADNAKFQTPHIFIGGTIDINNWGIYPGTIKNIVGKGNPLTAGRQIQIDHYYYAPTNIYSFGGFLFGLNAVNYGVVYKEWVAGTQPSRIRFLVWNDGVNLNMLINGELLQAAMAFDFNSTSGGGIYIGKLDYGEPRYAQDDVDEFIYGKFTCKEDMMRIYYMMLHPLNKV